MEYSFFVFANEIEYFFLVILFSVEDTAFSLVHITYLIFTDHVLYVKSGANVWRGDSGEISNKMASLFS